MNIAKIILATLIIVCSVVIVVSFFQPWAKADLSVTKTAGALKEKAQTTMKGSRYAAKIITGLDRAAKAIGGMGDIQVKTAVSGYDIPAMINKKSSKIALCLAQVIFKDAKDLDKKSLLVYLLPLAGLLSIILTLMGLKSIMPVVVMAILSGLISAAGLSNVMTADLSNNVVQISIEQGLWQTLYGFLLIFVFSLIWIVGQFAKRRA
jgi:hypothetical protein